MRKGYIPDIKMVSPGDIHGVLGYRSLRIGKLGGRGFSSVAKTEPKNREVR